MKSTQEKNPKNYLLPGAPGTTLQNNTKRINMKEYRSLVGQTIVLVQDILGM